MSALSTPGGGGTTAQSKPTSGKQKYQKLDINSLYCTNRNENSEPSSVKSQLSRKHGMQSLGKVPSTRRPPANLPSLKTETGQDPNANSISTTSTSVSSPPTCISQTLPTTASSVAGAGAASGGWVPLPPPSSPHFRTEFPSLEAAAQPSHRTDHATPQPQLRPQTEGSWTCGGTAGARPEAAASPAPAAPAAQTPAYRAILPSFLVKGSGGSGLGLGGLGALRERGGGGGGARAAPRAPATPRAVEVLTARPILRPDQISSLDDISRDAGWAQHDDIDYDQKLDFSDGESSAPSKGNNRNNRASIECDRVEQKLHEPGDEDQMWVERRQKQNNEVAQAVARARQRKEEQRRQMRDAPPSQDFRDRGDRDRNDNRERESDGREKERLDRDRDRADVRDRADPRDRMDRQDVRDKDRDRDARDKDRSDNRDRDRVDNRDRFDRDRDRDVRDRDRDKPEHRDRRDNRDRQEPDKERQDARDRERSDNRDRSDASAASAPAARSENRDRGDRDRFDRERDRIDRDRDRDRDRGDRERTERDRDRDRDFRDRDRDFARERDQNNPAFSKSFQANIPPRFLKQQQQSRQQDEPQHKGWAFSGKPAPRRQEPPPYNAPRHPPHNGRRSYSRDYSDREDDFRRDKDGSGPQWRSEMQDYERSGRELDRSNSKDSYKDFNDYKGKSEADRKSLDAAEQSGRSAADKLSEVFERKSIGIIEPFALSDSSSQNVSELRSSPPSIASRRESSEKDCTKSTSWAEVAQEDSTAVLKSAMDNLTLSKDNFKPLPSPEDEPKRNFQTTTAPLSQTAPSSNTAVNLAVSQNQNNTHAPMPPANNGVPQQLSHNNTASNVLQPPIQAVTQMQTLSSDAQNSTKQTSQLSANPTETFASQIQRQPSSEHMPQTFAKALHSAQKSEKEVSEVESKALKPVDPMAATISTDAPTPELAPSGTDASRRDEKRGETHGNVDQPNRIPPKEPVERKSSGSGSEKKSRAGFGGGGYAVYNRGWGSREPRGRRSHRSSRSNNRASESDGSTDGAQNAERKERRRAPRSPRGPKKSDRAEDGSRPAHEPPPMSADGMENREPFAPRGQPSRRGRGGFQGASRPPAPAKRVTGYGPPNTKSPFSQTNRAVKDDEAKDGPQIDDRGRGNGGKPRAGSSTGRGRDRRAKAAGGPHSGEDENDYWETTSEHSEGGTGSRRRSVPGRQQGPAQRGPGGRNQNPKNQNGARNAMQGVKKDGPGENKTAELTEATSETKTAKKDDDVVDDGFQEVRNKKKEPRGSAKEEPQQATKQQPRSHSNQGAGRNGSSSRNPADKVNNGRGSAQVPGKSAQYERPRQANLAPRFVKQRQKQQLGLASAFGPDTGAAPPPPAVNAWDKPLRAAEEPVDLADVKPAPAGQRCSPPETLNEPKPAPPPIAAPADKSGVLDGTTPPVETIIFENTNYKMAPAEEASQQKYQMNVAKPSTEEPPPETEARPPPYNGDVRARPRSIQELIGDNGRAPVDGEAPSLALQMSFEPPQKAEDSSDMKLDFAFDSDLGQLTEDKAAKSLGMPRGVHMSASNTISPLAADLNLKIASVKKVWEMPAVAEGGEELQFAGFEESGAEPGAPPNVCKVKPTQQLQSPPPQLYNHVGYQGGYGGLSVPSPPAMLFNSSQQLVGSSQQMPQQGGLYGAFLDQSRGQFGGFPGAPYGAGSAAPYNYQPPPDMFQSLPNQYRMAATAGGGAAFGQSGQLANSPSTMLISSTSNSLMSATVKPTTQQIGAIARSHYLSAGSKGGGVGGVGGVGSVSAYQQQYLGYSGGVGEAPYSLPGLLPRPAPPASSYYSPYQPQGAPQPTYPLQFPQPAQSSFNSQFLSSAQLQVAAAVQQMQQQYRAPMQQQYAPAPRPPPQQQLKSPLHEHANGFAPLCEAASPTPKGQKPVAKAPHSPPQHKYHAPPPHPPPAHTPHQHPHPQQMVSAGGPGRCGGGARAAPRYPAPIQRPLYRAQHAPPPRHHAPRAPQPAYYHHHQRNGGGERAPEACEPTADAPPDVPPAADVPRAPPVCDEKPE